MYAWADFNPIAGQRIGDIEEIIRESGKELINPKDIDLSRLKE